MTGRPQRKDDAMTPRQAYALTRPLNDPAVDDPTAYRAVRQHANGLLIMTILAVDR